jgi:hypothetical protein
MSETFNIKKHKFELFKEQFEKDFNKARCFNCDLNDISIFKSDQSDYKKFIAFQLENNRDELDNLFKKVTNSIRKCVNETSMDSIQNNDQIFHISFGEIHLINKTKWNDTLTDEILLKIKEKSTMNQQKQQQQIITINRLRIKFGNRFHFINFKDS